jgi:hypothetical protein
MGISTAERLNHNHHCHGHCSHYYKEIANDVLKDIKTYENTSVMSTRLKDLLEILKDHEELKEITDDATKLKKIKESLEKTDKK